MLFSQTHRFIYEIKYKKDSSENIITKEYYHLDINPKEILYYDRTFFETDSIKKLNLSTGFPAPKMNPIFSHVNGSNEYNEYEFIGWDIIKKNSNDTQNWKLFNEKSKWDNLEIQRAETFWGGRKWTAWFTTEIPFSEGPQKFHGLPGLIVKLKDEKNNYNFNLVNSKKIYQTNTIEIFKNIFPRALYLNEEKYLKFKLNFYNDPLMYVKNGRVDLKETEALILDDGTKVTSENLREITNIQQKLIKKYNNPIERDKIIQYPTK